MTVKVIDGWTVLDRWWATDPVRREYVVASWWNRPPLVFVSQAGDTFRIVGAWS